MRDWETVEFKNAGADTNRRVPYTDKNGRARIGDMGHPWHRAASINAQGKLTYRNLAEDLPERGFVRSGRKNVSFNNFSGPCELYTVQLCGVFRHIFYFRTSGIGYAWAVSWNFSELKKILGRLESLRAKERLYLTHFMDSPPGKGIPTEKEFDASVQERQQYSALARHLTRTDHLTGMSFVCIPGFQYVTDERNRALLIRLYRMLTEWHWKQSPPRGPRSGTRLEDDEKALVLKRMRAKKPTAIANEIARYRGSDSPANEALVKQGRFPKLS
jgi:hypothetical protein